MVEISRLQAKKSWAKGSSEPTPRANDFTFSPLLWTTQSG